jgi:hypothetical protein
MREIEASKQRQRSPTSESVKWWFDNIYSTTASTRMCCSTQPSRRAYAGIRQPASNAFDLAILGKERQQEARR